MVEAVTGGGSEDGSGISNLLNDLNAMVDPLLSEVAQKEGGIRFVSDATRLGLPPETIQVVLDDLGRSVLGKKWFASLGSMEDRGRERLAH